MQICHIDDLWMLAGRTQQDYPYIVAGCVSLSGKMPPVSYLEQNLRLLTAPEACHPVSLDLLLAELLQPLADSFVMIGCTIRVPSVPEFSGGVLGNPGRSACSAEGFVEKLEDDWTLVAFPGGPGLAVKGEHSVVPASIREIRGTHASDYRRLRRLAVYADTVGADEIIAVADGSGPGAQGAALIRSKSSEVLWKLEEVGR